MKKSNLRTLAEQAVSCSRCGCGVFTVRAPSFQDTKPKKGMLTHWYGECIRCGNQEDFGHDYPSCQELSQ
jgi:hypothetical protein